jgi:PPOX class probable F420-dependent enzyme
MMTPHELSALADETYVSLTTFRKSGAGVATPVKRIRHTIRVELTPCDMRGFIAEGAPSVTATATVLNDEETLNAMDVALRKKYGAKYRAIRLAQKVRGTSGQSVAIEVRA